MKTEPGPRGRAFPKVSIGLPVFNGERYLAAALDSLLAQTFDDFELIISDNGSTDRTRDICRAYAARDARIRYDRVELNQGAVWNFNRVFQLARGAYFKWAAYDDLCSPAFLQRCVNVLDDDPSVAWCHPLTKHIDQSGRIIPAGEDPTLPDRTEAHSLAAAAPSGLVHTRESSRPCQRFGAVVLGTTWCSDIFGLFRSSVLRRTSLHRRCYGSEKVLLGELGLRGRFREIPEVLFLQRVHVEASGRLQSPADIRDFTGVHEKPRTMISNRLRLLAGHLDAIWKADLSGIERLRCLLVLMDYVFQLRKWRNVLSQLFSARRTTMKSSPATNDQIVPITGPKGSCQA